MDTTPNPIEDENVHLTSTNPASEIENTNETQEFLLDSMLGFDELD